MTDREKLDRAINLLADNYCGYLSIDEQESVLHALLSARRATLDGWERASKCRQ